ncbi:hypothetical protein M407DRAFT_231596 [Tulasnella calospora MUT 4182]|uniref:F-box domain-containing protein n=1 Tax=Tulasnella calospora MUT 4182 TaxID=1051891 RepID=A0A0C3QVC9_9AGAM|nr:hypothetical protein M407DRAFT_231596 [Tulasnella calospora MUT 4182]
MHRIWAIPEVATTVLRLLEWPDQAHMARVCRGLWEMAIPLIWEEIYDISVFTAFLGTTKDDSEGLDIFTDHSSVAPHGGEPVHDRLAFHARFVRTMEFTLDSKACQVVQLLSNTPSFNESLVKLKSLDIAADLRKDTIDGTILFRTFQTHIMTRIRISVNSVSPEIPAEPLRSFVQAIATSHLPVLQSFYIESVGSSSIDPFYLEEVLRAHQRLQEVEIITADCTPETLEILKNLPVLRDLRLRFWHYPAERSLPMSPTDGYGFRHLVRLDIRCDLKTIKQVLGSIESDQMEAFKMSDARGPLTIQGVEGS